MKAVLVTFGLVLEFTQFILLIQFLVSIPKKLTSFENFNDVCNE